MAVRDETSDFNTVNSCAGGNDEYRLPRGLTGWAVDVGAHIGAVTVPLLLDNPDLRVIAIEAIPENVALLHSNLERNGVADRCTVLWGAATKAAGESVRIGSGSDSHHRYIGGMHSEIEPVTMAPGWSLVEVLADLDGKPVRWMKIDCEGCEYSFLDSPFIGEVQEITGEVHFGAQRLRDLLEPTHVVTAEQDFGPFTAILR